MPKYRDYFRKMLESHQQEFEEFSAIHAKYTLNQNKHQTEFNSVGEKIQEIARDWENRLCGHSEKGKFNKFSANLAQKFQDEIKAFFPMYDFIGVQITQPQPKADRPLTDATVSTPTPQPIQPEPPKETDPDLAEIDQLGFDNLDVWNIKKLL